MRPHPFTSPTSPRTTLAWAILAAASAVAQADVISLFPSADNTLYESATGDVSNGAGAAMFTGRNAQTTNSIRRGLLRFDPSSIPAGSIITAVTLTLVNSSANPGSLIIGVHRAQESWGEGTSLATGAQGSGAPAAPGDATWTHRFFSTTAWSTVGGSFAASPSAQTTVMGTGSYTWTSLGLVQDVQSWLDAPASNLGWLLRGDETSAGTAKRFSTREELDSSLRPLLTVTYIPGPSTSLTLSAALLTKTRRRRSA